METFGTFSPIEKDQIINFGNYFINSREKKEPIEWIVLEVKNNKALLISRYALDYQKYNAPRTDITWEKCKLRSWLNDTFINEAFSENEQQMIATTTVPADKNPYYSTEVGNSTSDKIFLFSNNEAIKYFNYSIERVCDDTAYAKTKGSYNYNGRNCIWWLRTPGNSSKNAAFVDEKGNIASHGISVDISSRAIRPALWLNLGPTSSFEKSQIIHFGNYFIHNKKRKDPIDWIVLEAKDNKALLISRFALDCVPYYGYKVPVTETDLEVTWENSTLRFWLNNVFIKEAFTENEKQMIMTANVSADNNPDYSTNAGNSTSDRLFVLSIDEVIRYYDSRSERVCTCTAYANERGAYKSDNGNCEWWLRTPGFEPKYVTDVDSNGDIFTEGDFVDDEYHGVRPALWIDIGS